MSSSVLKPVPVKVYQAMIGIFLYLSLVLLSVSTADELFEILKVEKAAENPCAGIVGPLFVKNYRGCSWYLICLNNEVARENRCPEGLRFNSREQLCDYRDNVECDFDDRLTQKICPVGSQSVAIIPHPYVCSKYTGNKFLFLGTLDMCACLEFM